MQNIKPGSILNNGKYRVDIVIGQGGFGITYLGEHTMLARKVAIKEYFPQQYCDRDDHSNDIVAKSSSSAKEMARFRTKFIKEAITLSKLNHPNIVNILDVFEDNGSAYFVMDYIDGPTLKDMVEYEPLPIDRAVVYIRKVAEALKHIHSKKINHLDVKPANIIVRTADNQPILIDFGLAKNYDSQGNQTSATPLGVSRGYAPLEQYTGAIESFSPESDIYSLGATLYKIITGINPPEPSTILNTGHIDFPGNITEGFRKLISKAMSVSKTERYHSADDFISDLDCASAEISETATQQKPKPEQFHNPEPTDNPVPGSLPVSEPEPDTSFLTETETQHQPGVFDNDEPNDTDGENDTFRHEPKTAEAFQSPKPNDKAGDADESSDDIFIDIDLDDFDDETGNTEAPEAGDTQQNYANSFGSDHDNNFTDNSDNQTFDQFSSQYGQTDSSSSDDNFDDRGNDPEPFVKPNVKQQYIRKKGKKSRGTLLLVGLFVAALGIAGAIFYFWSSNNPAGDNLLPDTTAIKPVSNTDDPAKQEKSGPDSVKDLRIKSYNDILSYTGPINSDSLPEGIGKAIGIKGTIKSYEGEFRNGMINGKGIMIMTTGDVFDGITSEDQFIEGTYTFSNKEYYTGTFKDSSNYGTGTYYSAKGKPIATYKDGESVQKNSNK